MAKLGARDSGIRRRAWGNHRIRGWQPMSQAAVQAHPVEVTLPSFADHLPSPYRACQPPSASGPLTRITLPWLRPSPRARLALHLAADGILLSVAAMGNFLSTPAFSHIPRLISSPTRCFSVSLFAKCQQTSPYASGSSDFSSCSRGSTIGTFAPFLVFLCLVILPCLFVPKASNISGPALIKPTSRQFLPCRTAVAWLQTISGEMSISVSRPLREVARKVED